MMRAKCRNLTQVESANPQPCHHVLLREMHPRVTAIKDEAKEVLHS